MAEYINREELLKDISDSVRFTARGGYSAEIRGANKILDCIYSAPTVDVVRCRDCKHFDIEEGDELGTCMGKFHCISLGGEFYPEPDYFCPYGERRSDNE